VKHILENISIYWACFQDIDYIRVLPIQKTNYYQEKRRQSREQNKKKQTDKE
jgi:hypothetical protein